MIFDMMNFLKKRTISFVLIPGVCIFLLLMQNPILGAQQNETAVCRISEKLIDSSQPIEYVKLLNAASSGDVETITRLLKVIPCDAAITDSRGNTPLHLAVRNDHRFCAQLLVNFSKKFLYQRNQQGQTPLRCAIEQRNFDLQDRLLVEMQLSRSVLKSKLNKDGEHLLHVAAKKDDVDIVDALLAGGVDPNVPTAQQSTALDIAVDNRCSKVVSLLCKIPNIDVKRINAEGWTVLHRACLNGSCEIVQDLLQVPGIDINAPNLAHKSDLSHNFKKLISDHELELEDALTTGRRIFGAGLYIVSGIATLGIAPLVMSATPLNDYFFEDYSNIQMHYSRWDYRQMGWTPLHCALSENHAHIVRLLCQNPAINVNATAECDFDDPLSSALGVPDERKITDSLRALCMHPDYKGSKMIHQMFISAVHDQKLGQAALLYKLPICRVTFSDLRRFVECFGLMTPEGRTKYYEVCKFVEMLERRLFFVEPGAALASGLHERLGAKSPVKDVPQFVVADIARMVARANYQQFRQDSLFAH